MSDMDAMGRMTLRADEDDQRIVERIREHLKESTGKSDDAAVLRFALRSANREISRKR